MVASRRRAAAVLAGVVAVLGLALGFWPSPVDWGHPTEDGRGAVACGSAFTGLHGDAGTEEFCGTFLDLRPGGDGDDNGAHIARCEARLSGQRPLAIAATATATGGPGLGWLFLTEQQASAGRREDAEDDGSPVDVTGAGARVSASAAVHPMRDVYRASACID
ncbi:hypothetical protein ACI789_10420 [Geodermatophilus sp. SYSU D00965]